MKIKSLFFLMFVSSFSQDRIYVDVFNLYAGPSEQPRTKQRNPEDIPIPRNTSRQTSPYIDYNQYVLTLKKEYEEITPRSQEEYINTTLTLYKKETEIFSYKELIEQTKIIEKQLELICEEYFQLTGYRDMLKFNSYNIGGFQEQLWLANTQSPEEQASFYGKQLRMRKLEQECILLHKQSQYNKALIIACEQTMQKKNDDYKKYIAEDGPDKLSQEEMPAKKIQIKDIQKAIESYHREIAVQKKALQKTNARINSFSSNWIVQAAANTRAALNSDNNQIHLQEKKSELENQIYATKKFVAHLENEQIVCQAKLDYVQKQLELYQKFSQEQANLIAQNSFDVGAFEQIPADPVQNLIYKKINETLAIAAKTQGENTKFIPYNNASSLLCTLAHQYNQQGQINASLRTCQIAQAIAQANPSHMDCSKDQEKVRQNIDDSLEDALSRVEDGNLLSNLNKASFSLIENPIPSLQRIFTAALIALFVADSPGFAPVIGVGAVAAAVSDVIAAEIAIATAGAVAAAGVAAIDVRTPLLYGLNKALQSDKVTNAIKNSKSGSNNSNTNPPQNDVKWVSNDHKHFPRKKMKWKETVKQTAEGQRTAKYHPNVNIKSLEEDVWKRGIPTKKLQTWKVMKFDHIIGASLGEETEYAVVKMSANTIHGQPISYEEYKRLLKDY